MTGLIGLIAVRAAAQISAPIDVPPETVTRTVEVTETVRAVEIRIRHISIMFRPDGKAIVLTRWEWVDANGAVIKAGLDRRTEDELIAAGVDVPSLKALFAAVAKASAEAPKPENK